MMNNTLISPSQVEATRRVVSTYMQDERRSAEENIDDKDVVEGMSELSDEEFYNRYEAYYGHIWFDLYRLSKI